MGRTGDTEAMTVERLMGMLKEYGAGIIKIIPRDENDKPMGAIIAVSAESAPEVLAVVEALEAEWEKDQ